VQNSGKLFKIGQVTGSGNLGGTCTFSSASNPNINTWEVGNADDFTYSGVVESNAKFTKVGTGKMTVNGDWTTTGAVAVNAGELHLNAGKRLGTGALTVAANSTLSGVSGATTTAAAKTPMTNSSITVNGTIQCGSMATATTGYWNMGGKNLKLNSTATWRVGLTRCATATNPGCATIIAPGALTLADGATLSVFLNESIVLTTDEQQADSFRIFSDATSVNIGNVQFDLPELPAGNYWDTSRLNEGYLFVRYNQALAVTSVASDEMVEVEVVNTAGATVANYTCRMGAVAQTLKQTAIPGGVYLLNIKSESGQQITLKQLK
jgi:autotransporter-associated beta strand protein